MQGRVLVVSNPFKILCRKQLSSAVYRFHRVGVIGSVAVLKEVGGIANTTIEGEGETGMRADNAVELFKQLCDELFDQLARVPASATRQADLFDELAAAIDCGSMHPDIVGELLNQSVQTIRAHYRNMSPDLFARRLLAFSFCLFVCSVVDRQCQSFIANIGEGAKLEPFIVDGKDAEEVLPCELGSTTGTALVGQSRNNRVHV